MKDTYPVAKKVCECCPNCDCPRPTFKGDKYTCSLQGGEQQCTKYHRYLHINSVSG